MNYLSPFFALISVIFHSLSLYRLIGIIWFPALIQFILFLCRFSSPPHDFSVYLHEFGQTRPAAVAPLLCAGCPYAYCWARPGVVHNRVDRPYRTFRLDEASSFEFRASLIIVPFSDCLRFSKFGLSPLLRVYFPLAIVYFQIDSVLCSCPPTTQNPRLRSTSNDIQTLVPPSTD
jgi:hypothetical protein